MRIELALACPVVAIIFLRSRVISALKVTQPWQDGTSIESVEVHGTSSLSETCNAVSTSFSFSASCKQRTFVFCW